MGAGKHRQGQWRRLDGINSNLSHSSLQEMAMSAAKKQTARGRKQDRARVAVGKSTEST